MAAVVVVVVVVVLLLLLLTAWLLAWSCLHGHNTLELRAFQFDGVDLSLDDVIGHQTIKLLVMWGAHLEGLDVLPLVR